MRRATILAETGIGGRNAGTDSYHGVILCDARGVNFIFPTARSIIDIGGQVSQLISIDEAGQVINFGISEICATGSARLLQKVLVPENPRIIAALGAALIARG